MQIELEDGDVVDLSPPRSNPNVASILWWERRFAEDRRVLEDAQKAVVERANRNPTMPIIGELDPLDPDPNVAVRRPFEPLPEDHPTFEDPDSDEARALQTLRGAFLHEIAIQLIRYGAQYVRTALRQMDYSLPEIRMFCKEARLALADEHLMTDVEEHRAISIARCERIFRGASDAFDLKTALNAQKHLDRITGVTKDEGAGALTEIAELAKIVCSRAVSAPQVRRVLDAEIIDAPVAPPIKVLTDEQMEKARKLREEAGR